MHLAALWRTACRSALPAAAEVPDRELLGRFREARDPVAFEVLVHRHGPMVWGACRRIVGNHHATEDAFQATFLALAQRASQIQHSVAAWLHRVAVRAGLDVVRRARPSTHPRPWSVHGGARFSADGSKVILAGNFDGRLRRGKRPEGDGVAVWDVRSGQLLLHRQGTSAGLGAVRLSPDGRGLTLATADGRLAIVEIASGKERASLQRAMIHSAAFHADGTKLAVSSPEGPVYLWDLLGAAPGWNPGNAAALWADLASTDARVAFTAIQTLRAHPAEGLALLRDRLQAPRVPLAAQLAAWLKQIDSPRFEERNHAQKELTAVADLIPARLEAARQGAPLEVVRRLDLILAAARAGSPESLRIARACEVLEGMGTAQAAKMLADLAVGPAEARLTREARESVARLARR